MDDFTALTHVADALTSDDVLVTWGLLHFGRSVTVRTSVSETAIEETYPFIRLATIEEAYTGRPLNRASSAEQSIVAIHGVMDTDTDSAARRLAEFTLLIRTALAAANIDGLVITPERTRADIDTIASVTPQRIMDIMIHRSC